jgi:hypothetical protein
VVWQQGTSSACELVYCQDEWISCLIALWEQLDSDQSYACAREPEGHRCSGVGCDDQVAVLCHERRGMCMHCCNTSGRQAVHVAPAWLEPVCVALCGVYKYRIASCLAAATWVDAGDNQRCRIGLHRWVTTHRQINKFSFNRARYVMVAVLGRCSVLCLCAWRGFKLCRQ